MSEPKSMAEYLTRFQQAERVSGYGLDTTIHVPCPFCAAPDWMVYKIMEVEIAGETGATCKECKRSARMPVRTERGAKIIQLVQTGGPKQPDWLEPKIPKEKHRGSRLQ